MAGIDDPRRGLDRLDGFGNSGDPRARHDRPGDFGHLSHPADEASSRDPALPPAAIDADAYEAAEREGALQRALLPAAVAVRYDGATDRVLVVLDTGVELAFAPWLVQGLGGAEAGDLVEAEISPSGHGVHFPRLNADVFLPGLLEGVIGTRRWMATMRRATPLQAPAAPALCAHSRPSPPSPPSPPSASCGPVAPDAPRAPGAARAPDAPRAPGGLDPPDAREAPWPVKRP